MLKGFLQVGSEETHVSWLTLIRKKPFQFIVLLLCLINITLIATNIGLWIMAARQKLYITADFTSFYTGFKMVLNGDGSNLYELDHQAKYQQEIMGDIVSQDVLLPYINPPILAVIFAPLALLPVNTAYYIWTIGELGLLIWLLLLINKLFSDWSKPERAVLTITILAFWPLIHTFLLGQFSVLFLICILQIYISLIQTKMAKAGTWLSFLSIKPQALVVPGIMSLNMKYWRTALTAIISGIVMLIFSSTIIGVRAWFRYVQVLPGLTSNYDKYGFFPNIQYTLRGILTNILGKAHASEINLISVGGLIVIAVIVWLLWLRGVSPDDHRFKLYFAFTIVLSVFFSLHANPHDDLILVFPAALFYDYLRRNNYPKIGYILFILICPLIFFFSAFNYSNLFGIFRPPVILIMVFLTWIIYYMVREDRAKVLPA